MLLAALTLYIFGRRRLTAKSKLDATVREPERHEERGQQRAAHPKAAHDALQARRHTTEANLKTREAVGDIANAMCAGNIRQRRTLASRC